MPNVVQIDPLSDPRWMEYISRQEGATIFHHPAWLEVLADSYGYRPHCLAALNGGGIQGVLPLLEVHSWLTGRRAVCLPFSDACAPLYDQEEALHAMLDGCKLLLEEHKWKYVEIRAGDSRSGLVASSSFKTHTLALSPDTDAIARNLKKRHKQSVEKAQHEGVSVRRRTDDRALAEFIKLNARTRRKHGLPPAPDKFFENLFRLVIAAGNGFINLAEWGGRAIAASIFLTFKGRILYKYSASDERFIKLCGNHLAVWDAISWACRNDYRVFDFGRSDASNEGLLMFKRGWGSQEVDLTYMRMGGVGEPVAESHAQSSILSAARPVLKKMPLPVLKFIGGRLYGHAE